MTRTRIVSLALFALILSPISARAAGPTPHGDISIEWNGDFTRANGIRSGKGTTASPYVISGWAVNNISIKDTTKAVRIENNTITGQLRLNFIGEQTRVAHNTIADLRVNENDPRWGNPTAGEFEHNTIGNVGQLRHFDGMFMHNTVGQPETGATGSSYPETRAVNLDGFNGAHFAMNTIYGYVEARLHGHHHASDFSGSAHMHAGSPSDMHQMDHTKRFHVGTIENNKIYSSNTFALEYVDTNHAANDRTANSETNPNLNAPHTHFTKARLMNNKLYGAGILVDVFNAKDERHKGTPKGALTISGNTVVLDRDLLRPTAVLHGIEVRTARYLTLNITKNSIAGAKPIADGLNVLFGRGSGVLLNTLDHATVTISSTTIKDRQIGIQGVQLTKSVVWSIKGLKATGVDTPVAYDASVANPPKRS